MYMGSPAVPARAWKEQLARAHSLEKLKSRVRALEQLLREAGKSFPPAKLTLVACCSAFSLDAE
jgi:hypothetical protein